jgi:HlyD family secretion protein
MTMKAYLSPLVLSLVFLAVGCGNGGKGTIEASGTIEGTAVNLGAEVAGRVAAVRVQEGSNVRAGDTLVVIDDADYQIQLRQAAANLEATEAQLRLALEGSRQEDITQAKAAFDNAERDYRRMTDLLASQTVTRKQFDDAEARYISAQQTYEKLARGLRRDEVTALRARRDQAAAQADQLRKKVRDCRVLAPADGMITLRGVEPGELVTPGSRLLRLTDLRLVKLTIYVNETELAGVQIGGTAHIRIDSAPDTTFAGTVVYISPEAEFTPKNVQTKEERTKLVFGVRIEVPNPGSILKPGMPADATIRKAEG